LRGCDDNYTTFARFAEGRHQIFTLWRVSGTKRFEDDTPDRRSEKSVDGGGGDAWEQAQCSWTMVVTDIMRAI